MRPYIVVKQIRGRDLQPGDIYLGGPKGAPTWVRVREEDRPVNVEAWGYDLVEIQVEEPAAEAKSGLPPRAVPYVADPVQLYESRGRTA